MNLFRNLSIRNKIMAIIVATTALALGAGFALMLVTGITVAPSDLVENHIAVAKVTGAQCVTELAFGDREEARRTLSKLGTIPDIQAAFLFDQEGELFAGYQRDSSIEIAPPRDPKQESRFTENAVVIGEPIIYDQEHYGTIYLVISTQRLRDKLWDSLLTIGGLLILLIGGAALLARQFESLISRPILELAETARTISVDHDYSVRAGKAGNDEVGELADGFNDMLEQIERRQRERDEADQRTREKSQFLANMSHELRTPLNAIIGFSEILRTRLAQRFSEKEMSFVDNINTSGQHLLGIVNDILDLSKIETGRMEIHVERFSVAHAIDSVCTLMRGLSARAGIALHVTVDDEVSEIEADPVKIKQVLYNLLSNAVKFSAEGSTVTIRATSIDEADSRLGGEAVRIDVIDEGVGIAPENHESIFREFEQVDTSIRRQFEGTGLGLALVSKFVEMHRGRVELQSELGVGSTFSVVLPAEFQGTVESDSAAAEINPDGHVALVIEDERSAFEIVRASLDGTEFQPIHAPSGEVGLEMATALHPAVIILDLVLPGMGGFDVLRALKSSPTLRPIPVVIVSMIDGNRELGLVLGVDDYLTKPVDPPQLISSLRRLLGLKNADTDKHILIVDDDPAFHEIVRTHLADERMRISSTTNGHEGFEIAVRERPSLILLDLLMGDMSGLEIALRLSSDPRTNGIPVLVSTKTDLSGVATEQLEVAIDDLLKNKELDESRIQTLVRTLAFRTQPRNKELTR